MRVGQELKAARKKAGISVEVISKRTKVKVSKLVALEKGDFKNLPTGLYLFSMVRAYAHEVHIDPEPIVDRLRAEFADEEPLHALHALDATGALDAKSPAKAGTRGDRSNLFRNAAIAAGVVAIAGAGAGAGAYLYRMGHIPREIPSTAVPRTSPARTVNAHSETAVVPPAPPAPVETVAETVDSPEQPATSEARTRPTKVRIARPVSGARKAPHETVATIGAMADTLGSSGVMPQIESSTPARSESPTERTGSIEDLRLDGPALAAAP